MLNNKILETITMCYDWEVIMANLNPHKIIIEHRLSGNVVYICPLLFVTVTPEI